MRERPAIGTHVRLLRNVGLPRFVGRTGVVVVHHRDGIAIGVRLDGEPQTKRPYFTCDWPTDVARVSRKAVTP